MSHRKLWKLTCIVAALALAAGIFAPGGALAQDVQPSTISGKVIGADGMGLGGVQCKVFVDGFLKGQAISGGDGSYSMTFPYEPLADQSIIAWWIPSAGFVPEIVVLRESGLSQDLGLWSPCLPRVDVAASIGHDVTVLDEAGKYRSMAESDCIEGTE